MKIKLNKEWKYNKEECNNSILDSIAFWFFEIMCAITESKAIWIEPHILNFSLLEEDKLILQEIHKRILLIFKQKLINDLNSKNQLNLRLFGITMVVKFL